MERRLTEERITKAMIEWLGANNWKVICFDFPQSGTGTLLHPNRTYRKSTKNKASIIPDIIAVKVGAAIFCENKDHFDAKDFNKLHEAKEFGMYSESLSKLLNGHEIGKIMYGVCGPNDETFVKKAMTNRHKVDFIATVDQAEAISVIHDINNIFIE